MAQTVENPPATQKTCVRSLGQDDPLEKGMATHFTTLCVENPMDRGSWQVTVQGGAKSQTQLRD